MDSAGNQVNYANHLNARHEGIKDEYDDVDLRVEVDDDVGLEDVEGVVEGDVEGDEEDGNVNADQVFTYHEEGDIFDDGLWEDNSETDDNSTSGSISRTLNIVLSGYLSLSLSFSRSVWQSVT